jgi:hypothetical protein
LLHVVHGHAPDIAYARLLSAHVSYQLTAVLGVALLLKKEWDTDDKLDCS